jgi:hypothetical protein
VKVCTTDGKPPAPGLERETGAGAPQPVGADGQHGAYWVICEEERAKGFVRPYRESYQHVGIVGPLHTLRDLNAEEIANGLGTEFSKFEDYPIERRPATGRYWSAAELAKVGKGCGVVTRMGRSIAETYARDPHFYGSTFCVGCKAHLRVGADGEFVWDGTTERVGT